MPRALRGLELLQATCAVRVSTRDHLPAHPLPGRGLARDEEARSPAAGCGPAR